MMYLTRSDQQKNMRRFYLLSVQRSLLGDWLLVSEWGRIGCSGTVRHKSFASEELAELAYRKRVQEKQRRGYR